MKVTLIKRNRFAAYAIVVIILSFMAFSVSCRKRMSHAPVGAAEPLPQASAPNGESVKIYHGVGVIETIDRKNNAIKINHEEIEGYMPAMSMNYYPRDRIFLEALKSGDRIEFILEEAGGVATIIEIKKR